MVSSRKAPKPKDEKKTISVRMPWPVYQNLVKAAELNRREVAVMAAMLIEDALSADRSSVA